MAKDSTNRGRTIGTISAKEAKEYVRRSQEAAQREAAKKRKKR